MQGFRAYSMLVKLFLVVIFIAADPINGLDSTRKLDENPAPATNTDGGEKCTPCTQYPPPSPSLPPPTPSPPPPSPSPPPPSPPPPTAEPPPSPKKPSTQYCPPPPSSFIYISGPPGNLYPVDENFNGASGKNLIMGLPVLLGCGLLLGLLAF